MTAPVISVYTTTSSRLNELPILDGQLIFVSDINILYLDFNGKRLPYNVIKTLETNAAREALPHPLEGYYFVEEDSTMWRYKDEWCQITEGNAPHYNFQESEKDFPTLGDSRYLYATKGGIYRWDNISKSYICVSNKTEWKRIGK